MTLQQQQQPGVVLGSEPRPIMPVVSVGSVGVATSQINQVQQPPMSAVQQLPLSVQNYYHVMYTPLLRIYIYIL